MSSANNNMFTFFFPVWMPFISYCVVAAARTCSIMLNKSGENRHSCLFSDLRGNTFSFCPFSMILAIGFSYVVFIMLRYDPSILTLLRVFIINRCWILSNASSASIDTIMWFLSFILFMWCITFIELQVLCHPWNPGINPT